MDKFQTRQGRKSKEDKILLYYGNPVSFKDVAKMMIFFMMNEDRVYNKPWHKGAEMIIEYFKEVLNTRKIPENEKYQLGKELVINED
tara:strand:- start:813 stop:1073 length:261 start_codon:yes stop_codon:yes gene_type:complete